MCIAGYVRVSPYTLETNRSSSMIYLYLKTHNVTGLKYLGQTTQDPFKYKGSGVHWVRHCNKHSYDIHTEILLESDNIEEISVLGKKLSEEWDIVKSKQFANMIPETGTGGSMPHTLEARSKMSKIHKGKKLSEAHIKAMAKANSGITSPVKKSVCAEGIVYPLIKFAAESINVTPTTIRNRIKNPNFTDYYYLSGEKCKS